VQSTSSKTTTDTCAVPRTTRPGGILIVAVKKGERTALLVYAEHDHAELLSDLSDTATLFREAGKALSRLGPA
jgi:hypothetical protein